MHVAFDPRGNGNKLSFDGNGSTAAKFAFGVTDVFEEATGTSANNLFENGEKYLLSAEYTASNSLTSQELGYLNASGSIHTYRGLVYELLVFNKTLSAEVLTSFQNLMNQRWFGALNVVQGEPTAPVNVTANGNMRSINLTWEKDGNSQFQIAYQQGNLAPDDCDSGTVIDSSSVGNSSSFTLSGLEDGTTYSAIVCSQNTLFFPGQLVASEPVTATTSEAITDYTTDGLIVHLDATRGVNEVNGSFVSWADPYSGDLFIEANGYSGASFSSSAFNGLAGIVLDNTKLMSSSRRVFRSVVVVYKMDSSLQNTSLLAHLYGNYNNGNDLCQVAADPRSGRVGYSFDGSSNMTAIYATDLENLTTTYVEDSVDSSLVQNQELGMYVEFVRDCDVSSQVLGQLTAGSGQHYFGGVLAEIMVYNGALTLAERTQLKAYLEVKWGISFN